MNEGGANLLLYEAEEFSFKINSDILKYTMKYIKKQNTLNHWKNSSRTSPGSAFQPPPREQNFFSETSSSKSPLSNFS